MPRTPHYPQIAMGPLSARPTATATPDWLWYYAWDDDGGAFWRSSPDGWRRATAPVGTASWLELELDGHWSADESVPPGGRVSAGRAVLRGIVHAPAATAAGVIAVLPEQLRPAADLRLPVGSDTGVALIQVGRDGVLRLVPTEPAPGVLYLDAVGYAIAG